MPSRLVPCGFDADMLFLHPLQLTNILSNLDDIASAQAKAVKGNFCQCFHLRLSPMRVAADPRPLFTCYQTPHPHTNGSSSNHLEILPSHPSTRHSKSGSSTRPGCR